MVDIWTRPPPPFGRWIIDTGHAIRIAEDGRIRITEDGRNVRIIERYEVRWNIEPRPIDPWIKEE